MLHVTRPSRPAVQGLLSRPASSLTSEEREAVLALARALQDPWTGYVPTPAMLEFHRSQAKNRALIAASQIGKTYALAREVWWTLTGTHPYRQTTRVSGIGVLSVGSLRGLSFVAVMKALHDTMPAHLIDWDRTAWNGVSFTGPRVVMKDGAHLEVISSRGGSTGAAGAPADVVAVDEPPKPNRWSDLVARVTRTGGPIILACTPYDSEQDLTWLQQYLEGDPDTGAPAEAPGWDVRHVPLSVQSCPWMTQAQVDDVVANAPAYTAGQRLRGEWTTVRSDGTFVVDKTHDPLLSPLPEGRSYGPWVGFAGVDHGELAGHQAAVLSLARQVLGEGVQVWTCGEHVSRTRSSFAEDAVQIRKEIARIAHETGLPHLNDPGAWNWWGDLNSAGKGLAGISANDALCDALGMRRGRILKANKGPGSVEHGLVVLRGVLDRRPCPWRLSGCPALTRALRMHPGADGEHLIDALRYGLVPLLQGDTAVTRLLPAARPPAEMAPPVRRPKR